MCKIKKPWHFVPWLFLVARAGIEPATFPIYDRDALTICAFVINCSMYFLLFIFFIAISLFIASVLFS